MLHPPAWLMVQVQQLAEKYFGGWQSMSSLPQAGLVTQDEPLPRPQGGSRHFEQSSKAGPLLMQAYYRPSMTSKDAVLLDIIWCAQQHCTATHKHSGIQSANGVVWASSIMQCILWAV